MKYIIQGLSKLHCLVQILRIGNKQPGLDFRFQAMDELIESFRFIDVSNADNDLFELLDVGLN